MSWGGGAQFNPQQMLPAHPESSMWVSLPMAALWEITHSLRFPPLPGSSIHRIVTQHPCVLPLMEKLWGQSQEDPCFHGAPILLGGAVTDSQCQQVKEQCPITANGMSKDAAW